MDIINRLLEKRDMRLLHDALARVIATAYLRFEDRKEVKTEEEARIFNLKIYEISNFLNELLNMDIFYCRREKRDSFQRIIESKKDELLIKYKMIKDVFNDENVNPAYYLGGTLCIEREKGKEPFLFNVSDSSKYAPIEAYWIAKCYLKYKSKDRIFYEKAEAILKKFGEKAED